MWPTRHRGSWSSPPGARSPDPGLFRHPAYRVIDPVPRADFASLRQYASVDGSDRGSYQPRRPSHSNARRTGPPGGIAAMRVTACPPFTGADMRQAGSTGTRTHGKALIPKGLSVAFYPPGGRLHNFVPLKFASFRAEYQLTLL
jgi:hypothetical protein